MKNGEFLSIFYPPGLMRGPSGTAAKWTNEQYSTLVAAGFKPHIYIDEFSGQDQSTGAIEVLYGGENYTKLVTILGDLGIQAAEKIQPLTLPNSLNDCSFYQVDLGSPIDGFNTDGIFQNQYDCAQPPPPGRKPGGRGCGLGKTQIKKLIFEQFKKNTVVELAPVLSQPYCESWRLLVVNRRVYELLTENDVTGVEFRPTLHANRSYSVEELAYDFIDSQQIAEASFFQMSITKHADAIFVEGLEQNNPCHQCHWQNGTDLTSVAAYKWKFNQLRTVDVQAASNYQFPNGQVVHKKGYDKIIFSSRLVQLIVANRVTGFSKTSNRFGPLFIE